MATIKSYTDISQSKKLAKILPLESADMYYNLGESTLPNVMYGNKQDYRCYTMCWSLAALLGVIRETIGYTLYGDNNVYMSCYLGDKPWKLETEVYDNEVDACYEMIMLLSKNELI